MLSVANFGNFSLTATATPNGVTVRNSNDTAAQPTKTAIRDVFTPGADTNMLTKSTYVAPPRLEASTKPTIEFPSLELFVSEGMQKRKNARGWAWGADFHNDFLTKFGEHRKRAGWSNDIGLLDLGFMLNAGAPAPVSRSEKMIIQARLEKTGNVLNEQIDHALRASGISLGEKERISFSIDMSGKISVTGNLGDFEGRKQILENILNSDDTIRSNLFLYQAHKNTITSENGAFGCRRTEHLHTHAYDWAHGHRTGMLKEGEIEHFRWSDVQFEFSYQNGKVFQGDNSPEDRVFSDRLDSLAGLGTIIGLDESASNDIQSFITALERNIASESSKLTRLLNAVLNRAGLGDVNKKITFSQDADGRIVVEGNIPERQKERLARIINNDSELSELIKTQSAKQAILDELKASITDEPANFKSYGAWKKHNAQSGFDLSKDSLASAREQLLKNFLDRNGVSMSELKANPDGVIARHEELGAIKGLRNEITNLTAQVAKLPTTEPQPLLAMKRSELVDVVGVSDRFGIDVGVAELQYRFSCWIKEYNRVLAHEQPGLAIIDYTLTFNHNGRVSFEVKTADSEKHSEQIAKQYLTTHHIQPDSFQELGLAILEAHDDEHGDVREHRHYVVIESGASGYRIESPEADQAALQEMTELMSDIGSALGYLFRGMSIDSSFNLIFGKDGLLSLDGNSLSVIESQNVRQMMEQINRFLTAEYEGGDSEGLLSDRLSGIAEKLLALKEVNGKIHDRSLVPEGGIRFAF